MTVLALALVGGTLPVRFATADLNYPEPLPLGGYTERKGALSQPGGDTLKVRVVKIGGTVLAAIDCLTIPRGFYEAVQQRAHTSHLLLAATHTHCAPDSQMLNPRMTFAVPGIAPYKPQVEDWYAAQVAGAINAAETSEPERVASVSLKRARADLNRARRDGAIPDPTAWLVSAAGRPLFASYAAHATFYEADELKTRGDWPGALADRLGAPVLAGAIGDVSPKGTGPTAGEKVDGFVDSFLRVTDRATSREVFRAGGESGFASEKIQLDKPIPHPTFAKTYGVPEPLAKTVVEKFAEPVAEVTLASWGSLLVVGVPGEPTAALGRSLERIGRAAGFTDCLVLSHVNGWIGYILLPSDYDRGGYEATLSFNGRETATRVEEAVRRAARKVSRLQPRPGRGFARAGS